MSKINTWGLMAFMLILTAVPGFSGDDFEKDYYEAMAAYFATPADTIAMLMKMDIEKEDLPVVLHIAQASKTGPSVIAQSREQGETWMAIIKEHSLSPAIFYFLVMAKIESKTFAPIFAKFKALPQNHWNNLVLTDGEIRDLVNLKFIYSYHDFSVFDVMKLRDSGKSYPATNNRVKIQKAAMIKEQKKQREEDARKKKDEGN